MSTPRRVFRRLRQCALPVVLLLCFAQVSLAQQKPAPVTPTDAKGNKLPPIGTSPYVFLSTNAVLSVVISADPRIAWAIACANVDSADVWVRLYDQSGAPGTSDGGNIKFRMLVPAGGGFVMTWPNGLSFATGLGIRVSGGIANSNATALVADTVTCNVSYGAVTG